MTTVKRRTNTARTSTDMTTGNGYHSETDKQKSSDATMLAERETEQPSTVNSLQSLATLYHFAISVFHILISYYAYTLLEGKEHIISPDGQVPKYGGPFKYLTLIHQCLQLVFFNVQFVTDILPKSSIKKILQNSCDFIFTTLVCPMAMGIVSGFWSIYAVDRNLIYPEAIDLVVPLFLNHIWHTAIVVWVMLDVLLCYRRHPTSDVAATVIFLASAAYESWIVWVFVKTRYWVYPILGLLPPPVLACFFGGSIFAGFGFYLVSKSIAYARWGRTD